MTKFVLPLLVFACAGFSQGKDVPADDPPQDKIGPKNKQTDWRALHLELALQGCSKKLVNGEVRDRYDNLDEDLVAALQTKLKLGMKRNKLNYDDSKFTARERAATMSSIIVYVRGVAIKDTKPTKFFGYAWSVDVKRTVKSWDGHHLPLASYSADAGLAPTVAVLKDKIDATLDKVFLAYLELPKVKTRSERIEEALGKAGIKPPPEKPKK